MADSVICVTFELHVRIFPAHPKIERVVKEKIRQYWADDSPLWRALFPMDQLSIRHANRRPQPTLKVEEHPFAIRVSPHGPHQEFPIDVIEKALDVEIEHPVIVPASLPPC
jgi:hypothetical protein